MNKFPYICIHRCYNRLEHIRISEWLYEKFGEPMRAWTATDYYRIFNGADVTYYFARLEDFTLFRLTFDVELVTE